jgi:hypothetical protein
VSLSGRKESFRYPAAPANRPTNNELRTWPQNFFEFFLARTSDFRFLIQISKKPNQEAKNFQYRDTHILLAGVRGYAPDPVLKSPVMRPTTTQ